MKHFFPAIIIAILLMASCKKELSVRSYQDPSLSAVVAILRDSMKASFASLDFAKIVKTTFSSQGCITLRFGFRSYKVSERFVLVKVDTKGRFLAAGIVSMDYQSINENGWQGEITIKGLDGRHVLSSSVRNGYIEKFHPILQERSTPSQPDPYLELPEVVIVSSYGNSGISWSYYISLFSILVNWEDGGGGGGSGGGSGWYSSADPYATGGGSGSTGGGTATLPDPPLEIEAEYIYNLPVVNIEKMFKCFDEIPSDGANYQIKLCSDIPSNNNPDVSANFSAASGGHAFLIVTKANGGTSVTQSFGFYPSEMPSVIDPFSPITADIKDNGVQEINASFEMQINEGQFNLMKKNAIMLAQKTYELASYNCTNYAMDIFNSVRTNPLTIQPYRIILPGSAYPWTPTASNTITIEKTPQMLFKKLKEMKSNNSSEASKIRIDQSHDYRAPVSKGECN